jgi:cysteine desulfurase
MRRVYLDHMTTTPLHPRVGEMMKDYMNRSFGNPMSLHAYGEEPRLALEEARRKMAAFLHADPREILFLSCGTEANNTAIKGTKSAGAT